MWRGSFPHPDLLLAALIRRSADQEKLMLHAPIGQHGRRNHQVDGALAGREPTDEQEAWDCASFRGRSKRIDVHAILDENYALLSECCNQSRVTAY